MSLVEALGICSHEVTALIPKSRSFKEDHRVRPCHTNVNKVEIRCSWHSAAEAGAAREAPNPFSAQPPLPSRERCRGQGRVLRAQAKFPPATELSLADAGLSLQGHGYHIIRTVFYTRFSIFITLLFIPSYSNSYKDRDEGR